MAVNGFVVDPSSISYDKIRADLLAFIQAAPDQAKWRDFFTSSTGNLIIDSLAGYSAFLLYNIITARRETFLPYMQNRSSGLAAAKTLGYSAFRGRNAVLNINVTPNFTGTKSKFDVLGVVKDQSLILLEDTVFNLGVPQTIQVVVGTLRTEDLQVGTESPNSFRFTQDLVSQDLQVKLNNALLPTSENMLDLINQKYVVISNVLGSVDVMYLNLSDYTNRYLIGDTLTLKWVELKNLDFELSNLVFDYGTMNTIEVESTYTDPESLESIKILAPLANETKFIIRGRDDYAKAFRLSDSTINSTDYTDVTAAVVDLCYARKFAPLFLPNQMTAVLNKLLTYRPMGLQPPTMSHPGIVFYPLKVNMTILNSTGSPAAELRSILEGYERVLRAEISLATLEQQIESLEFVKIARISINASNRANNTFYRRGNHVKMTGSNLIYEAMEFLRYSGATEPTWPIALNGTVSDGDIEWTAVAATGSPPVWANNTSYSDGDIVQPSGPSSFYFRARGVFKSGSNVAGIQATGTFDGVTFTSIDEGTLNNGTTLTFNGTDDVNTVVIAWNTSNPSKMITYTGPGSYVPTAGNVTLTGGVNPILAEPTWPGNIIPPC